MTGEGQLVATFIEAMRIWEAQKEDGVPHPERIRGLAESLKAAWPKRRIEPWHYLCERCDDTGWHFHVCTAGRRCGRPFKLPGQREDDKTGQANCMSDHRYVVPCLCAKGQERRRQLLRETRSPDDELAQVGKTKKMTRVGR